MSGIAFKARTLGILAVVVVSAAVAAPPYFWYSTYVVQEYWPYNCNSNFPYCGYPIGDQMYEVADGFREALERRLPIPGTDVWSRLDARDEDVTSYQFKGAYADVNNNDFALFVMHGGHPKSGGMCPCRDYPWGPLLGCWRLTGCNQDYAITWNQDSKFGYSGSGYLKWIQWYPCATLGVRNAAVYYSDMFTGLHCLMGLRSMMHQPENNQNARDFGEYFWTYWKDSGWGVWQAWAFSIAQVTYYRENKGVSPAALAPSATYFYETWDDATDTPAPYGVGSYVWVEYGYPILPGRNVDTTHCE